jgi:hypothetical protein
MELAGKKIFFGLGGEELGLPLKRSDSQRHDTQEQQAQCVLTPDEARVEVSQSRADVDVDVSRKQTNKKQNKVNDRKYQPKVLSRLEQSKKTAQRKKRTQETYGPMDSHHQPNKRRTRQHPSYITRIERGQGGVVVLQDDHVRPIRIDRGIRGGV